MSANNNHSGAMGPPPVPASASPSKPASANTTSASASSAPSTQQHPGASTSSAANSNSPSLSTVPPSSSNTNTNASISTSASTSNNSNPNAAPPNATSNNGSNNGSAPTSATLSSSTAPTASADVPMSITPPMSKTPPGPPPTEAQILKAQIEQLEAMRERLKSVRQVPGRVVTSGLQTAPADGWMGMGVSVSALGGGNTARTGFAVVHGIEDSAMSEPVQKAMQRARESLDKDEGMSVPSEAGVRRINRKRRRAQSPEVYVREKKETVSPLGEEGPDDVTLETLGSFARTFNETHKGKMRIKGQTVRLSVPEVMTVLMVVGEAAAGGRAVVQTIRAFGVGEKVVEHGQSAFEVFRLVSQQLRLRVEEAGAAGAGLRGVRAGDGGGGACAVCGAAVDGGGRGVGQLARGRDWRARQSIISFSGFIRRIIHVLGYTPTEGERGVPITVRIHFHPDLADAMYVRLVIGSKAVPTKVRQLPNVSYGKWQLYAAAPPFDRTQHASTKVLISVQALNEDNDILDTVTFGQFSYWTPGERRSSVSSDRIPRLHIPDGGTASLRRRTVSGLPTPSPTNSENSPFPRSGGSSQRQKTRLHRRIKSQSLMRTKHPSKAPTATDDVYAQTPILDLMTPLSDMCTNWTPTEVAVGRRLVRFSKVQDGRRLIVSCEPIPQEAFNEADPVISCIYRAESDSCYVTSVDVIYLLERLTNGEFPVEEKNRIRRNLEGLRPTTVSKHKPGFGDFFQRIMEFPDPKPRNIEKDLKVFDWNLLGQALEKILSKYSIYTTNSSDGEHEPEEGNMSPAVGSVPGTGTGSPELYAMQLAYPQPDEFSASRFLDQKAAMLDSIGTAHEQHGVYDPFAGIDLGELDLESHHHHPHPHLQEEQQHPNFAADGSNGPPMTDDFVSLPSGRPHSSSVSTDASLPSTDGAASDFIGGFGASPVDSVITSSSSSSSSSFPALGLEARSSGGGIRVGGPEIASTDDDGLDGAHHGHSQHPWSFDTANGHGHGNGHGTFKPGHAHHDSLALSDFGGLLAGYDLSKQHAPYAMGLGPGVNLHEPMSMGGLSQSVPGMHPSHLGADPNGHGGIGAQGGQDGAANSHGDGAEAPGGEDALDFSGLYENYAFNGLGDETLTGLDGYL
ncbi:hypothetical protein D9619_001421 [Psilocybe cf. subviscida]|uniref:DUF7082 domain-containing protein n=1 Tax=Psilocybe cf. subviscida TaxID=2480587 RepID=A0A8H5F316_9AGAR|nr:hypothetical protein D9619_001421 [Psilocybe cf. subviscida]